MLGSADREHRAREARSESIKGTLALSVIQCRRRAQIEAQLDAGVRGVDALTTRPRGSGELLDELACGHSKPARRAGPWWYKQIIHLISVPHGCHAVAAVRARR